MRRPTSTIWRLLVLAGLLITVASLGVAAAAGWVTDNGVLNQTQTQDPVGDSSGGPDLSSVTVTSYTDGTVSFSVGFANRTYIDPGESVQIFVDLDDDGNGDLNLSIWPTGDPSYLAHWTGSDWATVRQLPEVAQTNGSFSVRLSLADLRGAAAVPVGSSIGVVVGAWTSDPATTNANDWLPDSRIWIQHQIAPPAAPPTTTTTSTTTTTPSPPGRAASRLTVVCARQHSLRATVTPAGGSRVVSVSFYANGKLRLTDTKAPYVAAIPTKGLHAPITITAAIHLSGKTQTLRQRASPC
jgi:hypothetical protein